MVRVVRLERTVSWSQTRRDTNFAIPGYSISAMIPRRGVKIKIFLSVVIYVVKGDFVPLSAIGESPANAGVTRLSGVSPHPIPDTATALPKQARYQLRYTRICTFQSGSMRLRTFCTHFKRNAAFCRTRFPRSRSAAACAFGLHRRQACTFCNLRKIKFNTFFRYSQRFSALQFRVGCGMLYK